MWLNIINMPENSDFLALMLSKQLNPRCSEDPQGSTLCPNSQQTELWIPVNTRCNVTFVLFKIRQRKYNRFSDLGSIC